MTLENMTTNTILYLQNLSKSFGNTHALKNITLPIEKNSVTTIFGRSGVGKSVLLKCIIGLEQADSGKIMYKNTDIRIKTKFNRALLNNFSYLFQESALFDFLNVFENVAFPLKENLKIKDKKYIRKTVHQLLESVSLYDIDSVLPSELSGGMKKRVALARLLALKPSIMLCDEPTTGLDPITGQTIIKLIAQKARENNITCIIISHNLNNTLNITDNVAFIDDGKMAFQGKREGLFTAKSEIVQKFLSVAKVYSKKESEP